MTPIVLVPGWLGSAELYAPQIAALWPYGPVTVASTLTGSSVAEIADAILADAPPRFALAGMSMGGYVSFEIVRRAPERVVKLALLDTSARTDTPEQVARRRALVEQARTGDLEATVTPALAAIVHPSRRDDPALRAIMVRMALAVGVEGMARQVEAMIGRPDSRPTLPTIAAPTLVMVGDSDLLTPPDHAEEMASVIPHARLAVIPDCGHACTLERPDIVNRALVEWISA